MPREKEAYRDNLVRIMEAFPGKEVLCPTEVAKWLHMDYRKVKKIIPFKKGFGISVATLARFMS